MPVRTPTVKEAEAEAITKVDVKMDVEMQMQVEEDKLQNVEKRITSSFYRRDPASDVSRTFSKRFVKEGPKYEEEL